ncbi:Protein PLASTID TRANSCRIPTIONALLY ACTIVE 7 [Ananas comosus]|uniref:Protein PLASTID TRANSCRIPTIONALLY ACTIVE 7 n=1 Tax=Ananas comosus TaxID=4615 RepID=A0A199W4Q0_ANACO|nr:Protein PLASTID TRANSCRIPTIONALLY ACTIVE 7 [Ananas comosus]
MAQAHEGDFEKLYAVLYDDDDDDDDDIEVHEPEYGEEFEHCGDNRPILATHTKETTSTYKMERIPFLEEQVRKIRQNGKIISMDIEKLLLSEENRFAFVNEVAAEATSYIEKNRDEYGSKKAILHVLSNRMNEAGFYRTEAYMEPDPFKPGPNYLKEGFD